jgi:hypothetical protein
MRRALLNIILAGVSLAMPVAAFADTKVHVRKRTVGRHEAVVFQFRAPETLPPDSDTSTTYEYAASRVGPHPRTCDGDPALFSDRNLTHPRASEPRAGDLIQVTVKPFSDLENERWCKGLYSGVITIDTTDLCMDVATGEKCEPIVISSRRIARFHFHVR